MGEESIIACVLVAVLALFAGGFIGWHVSKFF